LSSEDPTQYIAFIEGFMSSDVVTFRIFGVRPESTFSFPASAPHINVFVYVCVYVCIYVPTFMHTHNGTGTLFPSCSAPLPCTCQLPGFNFKNSMSAYIYPYACTHTIAPFLSRPPLLSRTYQLSGFNKSCVLPSRLQHLVEGGLDADAEARIRTYTGILKQHIEASNPPVTI